MEPWHQLSIQSSEDNYEDFRSESMCCSAVFLKRDFDDCRVCGGRHTMTERRLECTSKTCTRLGKCQVIWKVFTCTARDSWTVWVNEHGHRRGVLPCDSAHPARITSAMKLFFAQQDEIGIPPRLILVNWKRQRTLASGPTRVLPTLKQVRNALKRIRRDQGSKNSRSAIQQLIRLRSYHSGMDVNTAFVFGAKLDREGYGYVGIGSDEDPFIVGISSLAMIDACLRFTANGTYCQFHADATFKVSDIGYPVITCGFTDMWRVYQVGAFFVVSRRTVHEYTECFRSFVDLVREVRGATLRVSAVMGDAEDAQYSAFGSIPAFAGAKMLMCFFHVLYNVRKRVQHLPIKDRMQVMASIVDMHYANTTEEYETIRDQELVKWRQKAQLASFADYFDAQWLKGRYSQWQSYHTPRGFACTNNPCENLNGALKSFLQRRRHHMRRLLLKLCDFIETINPLDPVKSDYKAKPTSDVVKAAAGMLEAGRAQFETTSDAALVRVLVIPPADTASDEVEENEFRVVFDGGVPSSSPRSSQNSSRSKAHSVFLLLTSGADAVSGVENARDGDGDNYGGEDDSGEDHCAQEDSLVENENELDDDEEEDAVRKQKDLYDMATKWSLRRAHALGMPHRGWWIDLDAKTCGCRYYEKFLVCAHLVAAQRKYNLIVSKHDPLEKLKNRIKATAKRSCSKQPKSKSSQKKSKAKKTGARPVRSNVQASQQFVPTGRPPRSASALTIQYILHE